jgi:hypothetical protein
MNHYVCFEAAANLRRFLPAASPAPHTKLPAGVGAGMGSIVCCALARRTRLLNDVITSVGARVYPASPMAIYGVRLWNDVEYNSLITRRQRSLSLYFGSAFL